MNFSKIKSIAGKALQFAQNHLPPPLREVLSEADGTGSYSRTVGFMIVCSTLGWVTYLVVHNHALPDMTGPALFVGGGAGSQYGINQIKNIAAAAKSGVAAGTPAPAAPIGAQTNGPQP